MTKPSIPQGTRDFLPVETARRNYIFATIKDIFKLYGFQPIETPAMENVSTLMGKYGEEGDKLLFKILNSGDYISKVSDSELAERNSNKLSTKISEKGLRYDLTVPFARYVVQHFNDITLPFKRFQIQPVWRADKPQKGRYREFYQCDVDVVGCNSLLLDAEYVEMIDRVFNKLEVSVTVKLNNRKILTGVSEYIGYPEKITVITVAIDKLDKIGLDAVNNELRSKEISDEAIEKLRPIIELQGTTIEKLKRLSQLLATSEIGMQGVEEIRTIFEIIESMDVKNKIELDLSLARGLSYYTGTIYEVKANDVKIGSICGGGRYDNLTGIFGMAGISGVGISFGADRIYDVLTELNLFPAETMESTKVLFINFGKTEERHCLKLVKKLRDIGISTEIYPEADKMKKQFGFANSKKIEYVAVIGKTELVNNQITLKNMQSGQQETLSEFDFMQKFI